MPYKSNNRRPAYGRARYPKSGGGRGRGGPKKENIHPSRFIKAAVQSDADAYEPKHTFADFDCNRLIKTNLTSMGIDIPTPIQDQAIPKALSGDDIVGIADTGTGKTLAFAIPVLNSLIHKRQTKALVLAPTRELAQQINTEFLSLARGSGIHSAVLIGGTGMRAQFKALNAGARLVIGTPGRIKDHVERRSLVLSDFDIIVLDEFDRMLDMGFVHDVRSILSKMQMKRQSYFFSATLDKRVKSLISEFSRNPATISVKNGETAENVEQNVVNYGSNSDRVEKLHDLLIGGQDTKALVFDDTQRRVQKLSNELKDRGFKSDAIHGGKSQSQRQRALKRFREGGVTVLVATDVAARGIDVPDITHVINYSTPSSYNDYIHRIGRTGRAGQTGYALTFIGRA